MHAQGKYNKPDDAVWPDWVASKSYAVGDKVTYQDNGYTCKTANSDATFTSIRWKKESSNGAEIAFVIGNGTGYSNRSNAFAVKWDGTLIMRDVSSGAYYKVYIDGGVLKTEAVE